MSKTKKIISVLLAVVLVMTMATVAIVSSSALTGDEVYVVVGEGGLCGSEWDPGDTANNQMTWNAEKSVFEKVYTNVAAGSYQFKVLEGTSWGNPDYNFEGQANSSGNAILNVDADGATVTIIFNGSYVEAEFGTDAPEETEPAATGDEPVATGDEPVVTEPATPGETVTVYFTNNWMFLTQNIYWWNGDANCGEWPGVAMTKVETNENGEDIYSAEVPADAEGIVFSGQNDQNPEELRQTVDITEFTDGMGFYCESVNDENKITVGTYEYTPSTTPSETTPAETTPAETTPAETTPAETTPAETTPAETTPAETTPAETTPAETGVEMNGEVYEVTVGDTITYTVNITAAELFENVQAVVTYDADKLELVRKGDENTYEEEIACPDLGDAIFNADVAGTVKFNASKVKGYDFREGGVLVTLDFIVKDNTRSSIEIVIEEMTIKGDGTQSYFAGGQAVITDGIAVDQVLDVPEQPIETQPVETKPVETQPVETKPVETKPVETKPAGTDATSKTDAPSTGDNGTVGTGATAYIYIALTIMIMAAAAVVVLRKKANG